MHTLSVVIITNNEEKNIGRCLQSAAPVADEIIVVDSGSTDSTESICRQYPGLRFVFQPWLGYGPQKNAGIQLAMHDYILSLDADEALSETLAAAILQEKQRGFKGAYVLQRLNNFFGKFARHGLEYPDKKVRIFNRQEVKWNDSPVHEALEGLPAGDRTTVLPGYLYHYSYDDLSSYLTKFNNYTSLAAESLYRRGKRASIFKLVFSPWFTFIKGYFFRAGFLQGRHGFLLAALAACYVLVKYAKLWLLQRKGRTTP
ncbi:glycosyltransferase family 2 protein [Chitinophaga japonensis]|uniref:Glycosyltransferase involved in cell wall biosynthesis n=1 Tax=Chitinophaga japonensis TaxID=104662 RepID=A0A562TDM5_CHIJA|nr:glycosyltransferase family 2 protein [Chitinophaga japonensis]TWI91483.1 glycosyltransferase involved in cell wall biosynthesis [Chitinophaga japonensis]